MRSLAVDWGQRRVGLALGDESGRLATPLAVLQVTSSDQAAEQVAVVARREHADQLVVGIPLNMDDTPGPSARSAAQWGQALAARCKLPVVFVDERLSSFVAEQSLNDQKRLGQKLTRKGRKQCQDALAAADFLQAFLDGRLQPLDPAQFLGTK